MYLDCSPCVIALPVKVCSRCGETKPLHLFARRSDSGKLRGECKACITEYQRGWRDRNPEKEKERARRYREQNPEKIRETKRQYRLNNADRIHDLDRKYNSVFRTMHHDKAVENSRRWRENNPEKMRLYRQSHRENIQAAKSRRRARLAGNGGKYTVSDLADIRAAQTDKRGQLICWICNKPIKGKPHLDHFIPIDKGGTSNPGNLHYTHAKCNQSKGAKMPTEIGRLI